jgi:hypothetical protein
MTRLAALLLAACTLLAGCAPAPQRLGDADRRAIRVVRIDPAIPKPPEIYYLGPGGGAGLMFGALGAVATESGRQEARDSLRAFLAKNNVSIERIVLDEFGAALRASGKLSVSDAAGPGIPTIKIAILQYGLSIPNGFSSNLVPILYLACEMVDASGKAVWSASDRLLTLGNPIEAVPGEEMRNSPTAIEKAWRAAARHLSAQILKEL